MKRMFYQVTFPATLAVVTMVFISAVFYTNANLSYADSAKKKTSEDVRTSAVDYTEARINLLQDALTISDAQKELWKNFTEVMRENAKEMDALTKDRAENMKTMNAIEQMKFHSQMTESRLAHMKKMLPPFEAFYASMTDEQKKFIDTIFRTGRHGKHKID
ncbi:MAG: Spy/CpxP family protein refolding chaperone [Desulfobacterales bacterium]|nr:Spy/CpxP family protein refolding chaperone [Desulfobacterales bacterium]